MHDAPPPPSTAVERSPRPAGFDLLRIAPLRAVVRSPLFPYVLQLAVLAVYLVLAVFAWGRFAPEGVPAKQYAQTNAVNLVIWGLWWPAMVWATVLLGRIWCAVCPLELVANLAERAGRRVGLRQWVLGRWLRAGWLILALFVVLQWLVPGAQLHRVPAYTSIFLWAALAAAAAVGFVYRDRAFCRGFCPVGLLLGVYGRGGMLAVRPNEGRVCDECPGHDCVQNCNRNRLDARSCPSLLNPAQLDRNNDCLVCGQCVKVCPPGNVGLYLRWPFSAADARDRRASWPVALFVIIVSGFVVSELCSEWASAKAVFQWAPERVTAWLGAKPYAGWIEGAWTLGVVPLALWSALVVAARLAGVRGNFAELLCQMALPLSVLVAAGHLCKGMAKFNSWVGYVPLATADPSGTETALAITAKSLAKPASVLPMTDVSLTAAALVALSAWLAYREFRLAGHPQPWRLLLPIGLLAGGFGFLVVGWGFLP
jgi:polyferredoxin